MKNKSQVCYQLDNKDIIYLEKFGQVMIILFSAYSMSQTFSISALANTKFYKRTDLSSHKAAWFSSPPLQKKILLTTWYSSVSCNWKLASLLYIFFLTCTYSLGKNKYTKSDSCPCAIFTHSNPESHYFTIIF